MGVRTGLVKRAARSIIEKHYARLTLDFETNKKVCDEVAVIPSKRLRNKIAGFISHLMKRIQRGPVRGISLKLQEEERERRMDFVPPKSALDQDRIEVDKDTLNMLKSLNFPELHGIAEASFRNRRFAGRPGERRGERRDRDNNRDERDSRDQRPRRDGGERGAAAARKAAVAAASAQE